MVFILLILFMLAITIANCGKLKWPTTCSLIPIGTK